MCSSDLGRRPRSSSWLRQSRRRTNGPGATVVAGGGVPAVDVVDVGEASGAGLARDRAHRAGTGAGRARPRTPRPEAHGGAAAPSARCATPPVRWPHCRSACSPHRSAVLLAAPLLCSLAAGGRARNDDGTGAPAGACSYRIWLCYARTGFG